MSYDRSAPTISSKAKKLVGSGNMGQNNWGEEIFFPVPLSDGLDTSPCKILDPEIGRIAKGKLRVIWERIVRNGRSASWILY